MDYDAQRYLNCLAMLLGMLHKCELPFEQLPSIENYDAVAAETKSQLDCVWERGEELFHAMLDTAVFAQKDSQRGALYVRAAIAALWMDQHISYQEQPGKHKLSLYRLVPLRQDKPVFVDGLNTNAEVSGVQLHPRFEVCKVYNQQSGVAEAFGNRDVYTGLNGKLNNVGYVCCKPGIVIRDVVIPKNREGDTFRIAFCPMSDAEDLLQLKEQAVEFGDIRMAGRGVASLTREEQLLTRFKEDLTLACRVRADVVFFPEMLGMKTLEGDDPETNLTVLDHALGLMEQAEAVEFPMMICLPTWWRDGINSATLVYQDGTILGAQRKYIPYVNEKGRWREALRREPEQEYLIVHVPGLHRIAVTICAEFPQLREHMAKTLCGELCVTLILVPSYSRGEQEFLNSLPTLKDYGVTVVWGNCCGAVKEPRVIGGCSIAGFDTVHRFGPNCQCEGRCGDRRACLYLVDIPRYMAREKPFPPERRNPVSHHLL